MHMKDDDEKTSIHKKTKEWNEERKNDRFKGGKEYKCRVESFVCYNVII